MTPLPERLRAYRAHDATADALMDEAAAALERLHATVDELRGAAQVVLQSAAENRSYSDFLLVVSRVALQRLRLAARGEGAR